MVKLCRYCGETKPLADFHRLAKSPDGRQPKCRACVAAYMRDYHVRNAEKIRAKVAAWVAANPERKKAGDAKASRAFNDRAKAERTAAKLAMVRVCDECGGEIPKTATLRAKFCGIVCQERDSNRRWKATNPDKVKANAKRYRQTAKDSLRRKEQRRRARRLEQFVEDVHPLVVLERDDNTCGICGEDVDPMNFHVDHIVPLSRGGEHSYANVQVAHPFCNVSKGARLPAELAA